MTSTCRWSWFASVLLAAAAANVAAAAEITSWTIDGGGGALAGGPWTLRGTFGQPDAGVLSGLNFTLRGGFWFGGQGVAPVDPDGGGARDLPAGLVAGAPYPNPFNPGATIAFDLPAPARARVRILNVRGELVATLLDEQRAAGRHLLVWDGRDERGADAAAGVYLVAVDAGGEQACRRVALVR